MNQKINTQAHQYWKQGLKSKAIECVVQALNEHAAPKPKELLLQFSYYLFLVGDYVSACQVLQDASNAYPEDNDIASNLVVNLSRAKFYTKAIEAGVRVLERDNTQYIVWDALAKCYAKTQQFDLAVTAGNQSLNIKDQLFSFDTGDWCLPSRNIMQFTTGKQRVIAFSLWGSEKRYINGAVRNLMVHKEVYPDWQIWIYHDSSVPQDTLNVLHDLGANLLPQTDKQSQKQKLCWRFKVANHADVGYFLVRDIDSVFSHREKITVEQWLHSGKWFHTIHDWWTHTDLILAGLWGGVANVLPNVWNMAENYSSNALTTPNIDQWFLRDKVWSYVKQSCFMHDRYYRQGVAEPILGSTANANEHIGSCEYSQMPIKQEKLVVDFLVSRQTSD